MLHNKILWFWFMKRVKDLKDIQRKKRKNGVTNIYNTTDIITMLKDN